MPPKETVKLSPDQAALVDAISSALLEKFLASLQSEDVANRVIGNWTQGVDKFIGRSMRRLGTYVFLGFLVVAAVKLGVLEKLTALAGKL